MKFPFENKILSENNSEAYFLKDYSLETQIPFLPHPGAFGKVRKNHIHEGIDLYCEEKENVYAMEAGEIVNVAFFTGLEIDSSWWNTTWCVMVEGQSGVINYGEIKPCDNLKVGDEILEGQQIGCVIPVLKKDKGRPMNMLHVELYSKGTRQHLKEWTIGMDKPENLLDPSGLLKPFLVKNKKLKL